jgi:hypothetical protein
MSGSWVIRDGSFCGVMYAAYRHSPYIHMLPAESVLENIKTMLWVPEAKDVVPKDTRPLQEPTDELPDTELEFIQLPYPMTTPPNKVAEFSSWTLA